MPSRKKAKGKARKAAKEAKAKEEESHAVREVAASQQHVPEEKLEERMERVILINAACPTMCRHGCPPLSTDEGKICCEFINQYMITGTELTRSRVNAAEAFATATDATADEYIDVYASKLDTVISIILLSGTQCILNGDNHIARLYASLACYFKECLAVAFNKSKVSPNLPKIIELYGADDHTLVSYYRNRIPCACLDQKYKEVKSVKKMGHCFNPNCSHPDGRVERSKTLCCTRCGIVNYCSVECQGGDWKKHKQACDTMMEKKTAFKSKQT